jgi:heme-degrading monooxygenase HmoA
MVLESTGLAFLSVLCVRQVKTVFAFATSPNHQEPLRQSANNKEGPRMSVKIMIRRTVPPEKISVLGPLLKQLRNLAVNQSGYISGETLKKYDEPGSYLVISTWQNIDDWKNWVSNPNRMEIQSQIDLLTGIPTETEIYTYS